LAGESFRVLDSLESKRNACEDLCYIITSKCEYEMLHTYIEICASDKLAAVNQMQTLDCNLQGQHFRQNSGFRSRRKELFCLVGCDAEFIG
jgi:hypothetical protein